MWVQLFDRDLIAPFVEYRAEHHDRLLEYVTKFAISPPL